MAQFDFGTLDPATVSGTALASDLTNWRDALNSAHSGSAAPTYAIAGMSWLDNSATPWTLKRYDGASWVTLGTINPTTHVWAPAGLSGLLVAANNLSDVASPSAARGNIGAAASGANSDITSLTGLTTALSIAQGGTGATSAAAARSALGITTGSDNLGMRNALKLGILAGDSSGAIPSGWLHLFASDELATKTGAMYDSSTKRYLNSSTSAVQEPGSYSTTRSGTYTWLNVTMTALTASSTLTKIGVYFPLATSSGAIKVLKSNGSNWDVVYSESVSTSSTGWVDFTLTTPYAVPSDGHTYRVAYYDATGGHVGVTSSSSGGYYYSGNATGTGVTFTAADVPMLRYTATYGPNAMTLIPSPISVGSVPTSLPVTLLHQAIDTVTLGTDLRVRASRDGGSTWSAYATITDLGAYNGTYKQLAATCDLTTTTSGTSVVWEVTTPTAKAQALRAVGWTAA